VFCWSEPQADCSELTGTVWVKILERDRTDPRAAAKQLQSRSPGEAVIFLWDAGRGLYRHGRDAARTPDGKATRYSSLWPDNGIADTKARVRKFFEEFKAAGGRVDYLVLDFEEGMSNWVLKPEAVRAIAADPRSAPVKKKLGFDFEKILNPWAGNEYLAWNALMDALTAQALNKAIFEPVRELFPNVQASNFNMAVLTPENVVPDWQGHLQHSPAHFGTRGSHSMYGEIGLLGERTLAGSKPYGREPFAALRWDLNTARAILRSSNVPFDPWIAPRDWEKSSYQRTPYYQELLYHLALSGAGNFLFWNPRETAGGSDEGDLLLNACVGTIHEKLGRKQRGKATLEMMPWDAEVVATGLELGDRVLWRISSSSLLRDVRVQPGGPILQMNGRIGRWYESKPGENLKFEVAK